jgi:hypothetical protein
VADRVPASSSSSATRLAPNYTDPKPFVDLIDENFFNILLNGESFNDVGRTRTFDV